MNKPPAGSSVTQEACGVPRGSRRQNPNHVRVINPPWLDTRVVKRKTADYYVREGQAVYDGCDIRMDESHPQYQAALAKTRVQKLAQDRALNHRRVIFWNGSDTRPGATHLPGASPLFRRPDSCVR